MAFVLTSDPKVKPYPFVGGSVPAKFSLESGSVRGQSIGYCEEYAEASWIECGRRAWGLPTPPLSTLYMPLRASLLWYGDLTHEDLPTAAAGMIYRDFGICTAELHSDYSHNARPSPAADADAANRRGLENYSVGSRLWTPAGIFLDPALWEESISKGYPVAFGLGIWESWMTVGQDGLVPMPDPAHEKNLGGHAIYAFGYDRDNQLVRVHDNQAGGYRKWLPYKYLLAYGFPFAGAWALKHAADTQTFPFPPPIPPTGVAVTYDQIVAAIQAGQFTPAQIDGLKAAVAAKTPPVVVTPPAPPVTPSGMSPEGFQIPRDGLTITTAKGSFSLAPDPDRYGERPVSINGVVSRGFDATSAKVERGQIIVTQRGGNVSRWDWTAGTTVRYP